LAVPKEDDIEQGQNSYPESSAVSYCTYYRHVDRVPYQTIRNIREVRVVPENLSQVR